MNQQILEYDLYLDESGDFKEASEIEVERLSSQNVPSQLAGLLVPRDTNDEGARAVTMKANKQAGFPLGKVIHATEIIKRSFSRYLSLTDAIIKGVQAHAEWQPVRLVNLEKVPYYDRATTYPNLVAELTLRTFHQKLKEYPNAKICIRLIDPNYEIQEPVEHFLSPYEYAKRIFEYLGFASVRYGLARERRSWRFDGIVQREYRNTPAVQICDVISHASSDKFDRLRTQKPLIEMLKRRFGDYDFTLTLRELFDRVDELIKEYSLGMALMILAEALVHAPHVTRPDKEFAAKLQERLSYIIERLGRMDYRGRDPQLALLIGWLDQIVGQQRLLDKGYEIAHWLLDNVETPLRDELSLRRDEATLDWFAYSLRRWAVTACNHKGVLLPAQVEVEAMKALQPSLAKQWERIPLVMDGLIAQAVHYTDCFEFHEASRLMHFVSESLKTQSNRFHELLPNEFPEKLRFDLRARALGTLVQSEMFAGATDPNRLQSARHASEEAVAEFNSFSDRARQYQYRCHLETVARDFPTARGYLVRSFERTDSDPTEDSHNKIADLIRNFSIDPDWKAEFALVHWLRIGAYASLDAHEGNGDRSDVERAVIEYERDQFLAALEGSGQLDSDACKGRLSDYPAHSILRFVAVINAARGQMENSLKALQALHSLDPIGKGQFVLAMILLAAQSEVAALVYRSDETIARTLLGGEGSDHKSLTQLVRQIEGGLGSRVDAISAILKRWRVGIEKLSGDSLMSTYEAAALLKLAGTNAY